MAKRSHYATVGLPYICILLMTNFVSSDVAKDREECANQLVGLATCLPYVGGTAKSPTPDCCTGLKQVLQNSKKCLCVLVKDRNDPSLGLKINSTLALSLPTTCHASYNVSECLSLLHLAPNSPDAQVFKDFANSSSSVGSISSTTGSAASTRSGTGSSTQPNSDGGRGKKWWGVDMVGGFSLCFFTSLLIIGT